MIFNFITELLLKGDKPTETFIGFFIAIAFLALMIFILATVIGVVIGDKIVWQFEKKTKNELKLRYHFLIVILSVLSCLTITFYNADFGYNQDSTSEIELVPNDKKIPIRLMSIHEQKLLSTPSEKVYEVMLAIGEDDKVEYKTFRLDKENSNINYIDEGKELEIKKATLVTKTINYYFHGRKLSIGERTSKVLRIDGDIVKSPSETLIGVEK
jgi:hypothetical protein